MCGDTECGSCGLAEGTLAADERMTGLDVAEPVYCARCGYEMPGGPDAVCMTTGRGYHAECVNL